jgi:hypothetical protein|tara:strand:+ start:1851 stop:2138 length:288 start_codon:yes stop_codon:yes gene_type:complete
MSQLKCTADGLVSITDADQAFLDSVKAQDEAWAAGANDRLAAEEREKRNALLAETDYFGASDVTMSSDMTAYRQALRDVPQQKDFPTSINWPTKP